jgi:DNA ligase-associated metallophosphoesterase
MKIELGGEIVELAGDRALYWPARRLLMIADIHFGKAASFRAKGIPVPNGTTSENLARVDRLLAQYPTGHIVFLGDFLHARGAFAAATMACLSAWRKRNPGLKLTLVRGNHDRHAGDPPASLAMEMVDEPFDLGPFSLCHYPEARPGRLVIAGHVHPVFQLRTRADCVRLPCFVIRGRVCILPSFGEFTGGYAIDAAPGQQIYLAVEDRVLALPMPR